VFGFIGGIDGAIKTSSVLFSGCNVTIPFTKFMVSSNYSGLLQQDQNQRAHGT
jgi:hypothetical protein